MSKIQHKHIVIRAVGTQSPENNIDDMMYLNDSLNELIVNIGMKVVLPARAFFVTELDNEGWTGQAGLETSHIAYHIWNNSNMMQFDLYTCGCLETLQILIVKDWVRTLMGNDTKFEMLMLDRKDEIRILRHER